MRSARTISKGAVKFHLFCAIVYACASTAVGQLVMPETGTIRSRSGQFIVHPLNPSDDAGSPRELLMNNRLVHLESTFLTVSCERIKENLTRELGLQVPWRGKIHVALYSAQSADDPITVTSDLFRDGWQYHVNMPDRVERTRFVRAIVQVILLEIANRSGGSRSAEIPLWLTEGLTQIILASSEAQIILPPPRVNARGLNLTRTDINARRENPLGKAHEQMRDQPSLTFEDLSWPLDNQLTGPAADQYRNSAQLFVHQLLDLKDGPACMCAMLAALPQNFNWQFAFLRGYQRYFQRPLDVEKWWTLNIVHFTGRELTQTYPVTESWQKLDDAIRTSVEVRAGVSELPMRSAVTLQTILRTWDHNRQTEALRSKLHELELLRSRLAPELVPVADGYHETLANYFKDRDKNGFGIPSLKKARWNHAAEQAAAELDSLDVKRSALRPRPQTVTTAQARDSQLSPR